MEKIALILIDLTPEEIDELFELIYSSGIDTVEYNEMLLDVGIDVSGWCKRKHPPAG